MKTRIIEERFRECIEKRFSEFDENEREQVLEKMWREGINFKDMVKDIYVFCQDILVEDFDKDRVDA